MKTRIRSVSALELLDSRGFPTVRVNVSLDDGTAAPRGGVRGVIPARQDD
ncbi:MAG: hypothetical protein PHY45_01745 [Rhodocyclaceae bacterium]|nr:hypothetical protein [Rhodocyclaceae bacterium]